jgi:hypothetical protein
MLLLVLGTGFSAWLGWKLIMQQASLRRLLAFAVYALPLALIDAIWVISFFR